MVNGYGIRHFTIKIETGRFVDEQREDRICTLCNSNSVQDQIHFLFHCPYYDTYREELYMKSWGLIDSWDNLSDIEKNWLNCSMICQENSQNMLKIFFCY